MPGYGFHSTIIQQHNNAQRCLRSLESVICIMFLCLWYHAEGDYSFVETMIILWYFQHILPLSSFEQVSFLAPFPCSLHLGHTAMIQTYLGRFSRIWVWLIAASTFFNLYTLLLPKWMHGNQSFNSLLSLYMQNAMFEHQTLITVF